MAYSTAKYKFLVVDDEADVIRAIQELLKSESHIEILGCPTPEEAIEEDLPVIWDKENQSPNRSSST